MNVTLLGSGDAVGMPVPFCECDYCRDGPRRHRPGLLVETEETTVLIDASPDLCLQVRNAEVTDPVAIFLTHAHHDHVDGLHAVAAAGRWPAEHLASSEVFERADDPITRVLATATAWEHLRETRGYLLPQLNQWTFQPRDRMTIGDLLVVPFPVDHARPTFQTVGFVIEHGGSKVVYAPDVARFDVPRIAEEPDRLFVEGAALFGTPLHGPESSLRSTIERVGADATVLLSLSEHKARMRTDELANMAGASGYELSVDFETYRV